MIKFLKYKGEFGFQLYRSIEYIFNYFRNYRKSDESYIKEKFFRMQGYSFDINNPQTLNEKIQWLKINCIDELHTQFADKYLVREFVKNELGEEYLIPMCFTTTDYKDIVPENLPDFPCIIKTNHDSGNFLIVKNKFKVDWEKVQIDFRLALSKNYYWVEREQQYKNIIPRIIIEKLLVKNDGKIPNDFKFHVINGKVQFIYVSIDREGENKRNIYDRNWNPIYFTWANKNKDISNLRASEIIKPNSIEKMIELAEIIGVKFPYVRIDFYDVDGVIYFGEITQHHGGGFDQIKPFEFDLKYGQMLNI
jgi:hypothetical protein